MTHLEALPSELLARVISFLDKGSLAQVRLVNTRFDQLSVKPLFTNISLFAHWKESRASENQDLSASLPARRHLGFTSDIFDEPLLRRDGRERRKRIEVESQSGDSDEWFFDGDPDKDDVESPVDDSEISLLEEEPEQMDVPIISLRADRRRSSTPPQWLSDGLLGPPYNAILFRNILEDATLKKYVKKVQIYTCNTDCDFHPSYKNKPRSEFDPVYIECIERLKEFPSVHDLSLYFDRHASRDRDWGLHELLQDREFQPVWLSRILSSVGKHQLSGLGIRHYENSTSRELPTFLQSATNLRSLRLSIKHEETNRLSIGGTYKCGNIHNFWDVFAANILEPQRQQLTTLVLYSDLPLGWFPKLDLRNVHFPKLRSLTLGQHIFHNKFQVDWIISHKSTLEELYLDRCSILYSIGHTITDWLDKDGFPKPGTGDYGWSSAPGPWDDAAEFAQNLQFVSIALRWYEIFPRLTEEMDKVRDFRFGESKQWKMDTLSRYDKQGVQTAGHPIMPWKDEKNIENQILESRYMIYDDMDQRYRPTWAINGLYNNNRSEDRGWRDEWKARFELYPDCQGEDVTALKALLDKVKGR